MPKTRLMTKEEKAEIFKVLEEKLLAVTEFIIKYIPPFYERKEAGKKIIAAGRLLDKARKKDWLTLDEQKEPNGAL